MASPAIALRRLVSQRIVAGARCEQPADVVRRLGALQAQDYGQSLWAIGSRLRAGTAEGVERAIEQRQIVRTWLMRGTIHFAPPEDVRWLLALVVPRLEAAEARRCAQLGLTEAHFERCADLLSAELSGDRRLTRPEVMRLFEQEGIETSGQRGYHILVRLAKRALICLGPLEGRQQTFVLLDEWAPRASSLELAREQALALLASRFASGRGPVTDQDFARWAGIPLSDARQGLRDAAGIAVRSFGGVEHWLDAERADGAAPAAGRAPDVSARGLRRVLPRLQGPRRRDRPRAGRQGRPRRERDLPAAARDRRADRRHLGALTAPAGSSLSRCIRSPPPAESSSRPRSPRLRATAPSWVSTRLPIPSCSPAHRRPERAHGGRPVHARPARA